MKRLIFVLITFVTFTMLSSGQEMGKNTLEVTFNPAALFDGSAGPLFEMPFLKARFPLAR